MTKCKIILPICILFTIHMSVCYIFSAFSAFKKNNFICCYKSWQQKKNNDCQEKESYSEGSYRLFKCHKLKWLNIKSKIMNYR